MIYDENDDPLGMDAPFAPIKEGKSRLPRRFDHGCYPCLLAIAATLIWAIVMVVANCGGPSS